MQTKALYTVIGLLITLLGWLWSAQYYKLAEIEHSLTELKVEVTKLQCSILTEERVKEIATEVVEHELLKRGLQ